MPAPTARQYIRNSIIMVTCLYIGWKCDKITQNEMDTFKGKSRTFGDWTSPQGPNHILPEERKYIFRK